MKLIKCIDWGLSVAAFITGACVGGGFGMWFGVTVEGNRWNHKVIDEGHAKYVLNERTGEVELEFARLPEGNP